MKVVLLVLALIVALVMAGSWLQSWYSRTRHPPIGHTLSQLGMFVVRSDDFGETWSEPVRVAELRGHVGRSRPPSLALCQGRLYLFWVEEDFYVGPRETRNQDWLWITWSDDEGQTWGEPEDLAPHVVALNEEATGVLVPRARMVGTQHDVYVVVDATLHVRLGPRASQTRGGGLFYLYKRSDQKAWSGPVEMEPNSNEVFFVRLLTAK